MALAVVAVLSTAVVLARDDGQVTRVAARGGASGVRVVPGGAALTQGAGTGRAAVPIALDPDQGYVRGPLVVSGSTLSLAAYDHDGVTFTYPPSRIVRVDTGTFREEGRTDLKAEILSIADGDGARWVVTRNPAPANGLPDAFLKRIGADGALVSKLLPPGSDPVGNVAVGAGSVWIPVRDGVLRYDAATAQFVVQDRARAGRHAGGRGRERQRCWSPTATNSGRSTVSTCPRAVPPSSSGSIGTADRVLRR